MSVSGNIDALTPAPAKHVFCKPWSPSRPLGPDHRLPRPRPATLSSDLRDGLVGIRPLGVIRVHTFYICGGALRRHDCAAKLAHGDGSQRGGEAQLLARSHVNCPTVEEVDDAMQVRLARRFNELQVELELQPEPGNSCNLHLGNLPYLDGRCAFCHYFVFVFNGRL